MQGENLGGGCSGVCGCGGGGENKNKSEIAKEIGGYIESLPISSFVLGSMLSSYPQNNFNDLLPNLIQQVERGKKSPNLEQSWLITKNTVLTWSKEKTLEDLRAEYVDLFERGHKRPSPYESEY